MNKPYYIFLDGGQFIRVIANIEDNELMLIHPFLDGVQVNLTGSFAHKLFQQLQCELDTVSFELKMIEKQYDWLEGLSQASLQGASFQNLVIGDELGLLFLEVTDQCNEQCIHCYASSSPACSDFLSLEEIKKILDQVRVFGQAFVQFTGGDPLIHKQLVNAVAYANSLDFQGIEIYTNGLLLTDELLESLLPYQPKLAFSLYSPDEATHDGITQVKGSFKKTISAIHRAQDMAFQVRIGMAVMEQNAGHEQTMLGFAASEFGLDASAVRFDPVHETGRGSNLNTKHITLLPSQNSHMPDKPSQPLEKEIHRVIQQDKPEDSGKLINHKSVQRRGKLAVCANGDVSPCIFNREHVLGNIRQQTLQDILASKEQGMANLQPSVERWNHCQEQLSCSDCQMVAYSLGDRT